MSTEAATEALTLLRRRLCDPTLAHAAFKDDLDSNYSKLKFIISTSISEVCNNSVLLLGPRGSEKASVVKLVIDDLLAEFPDTISVVKLNGLLHGDDICALKEIVRQLCLENHLQFSKTASSDDNSQFVMDMLRECGLAHRTIIFILEEFDLFAQGKQRLLYNLMDAMQTLTSQAVVIGISCRLDADQLLEKRVRSRFSHRKILFIPTSIVDMERLFRHLLTLPEISSVPSNFTKQFNMKLDSILGDKSFKDVLNSLEIVDSSISNLIRFLYVTLSSMDLEMGFLTMENFSTALRSLQRQHKLEMIKDSSVLEFYLLVCMRRLETKEQTSYNFNSLMKEYKAIQETYKTLDNYAHGVCLRAYEHLIERELIGFTDCKGRLHSIELRPVKLLISSHELSLGLKSNPSCPASLQKLLDHETYK